MISFDAVWKPRSGKKELKEGAKQVKRMVIGSTLKDLEFVGEDCTFLLPLYEKRKSKIANALICQNEGV